MQKGDFDKALNALFLRTTEGDGVLSAEERKAVATGSNVPDNLQGYVEKIQKHAYKVVDEDIAGLKAAGYSEDAIFEVTISAAVGAGMKRWRAALAAIEEGAE